MSASTHEYIDARGARHTAVQGDCRIVSLVPSLTELLFDLGLGGQVVGRTGFCIHPAQGVRRVPKVGGTKDVKMDALLRLEPTHLVVNMDENRRETVDALAEYVPNVIVTHPCAPADNIELYRLLGGIFGKADAAEALAAALREELQRLESLREACPAYRVLYLIWRKPWMTVGRDTYISGMLGLVNWITVDTGTADRYPVVENLTAAAQRSDLLLLSSEPYRFTERHVRECRELAPGSRVLTVDGEMLSWYGSRAVQGLRYVGELATRTMSRSRGHTVSVH